MCGAASTPCCGSRPATRSGPSSRSSSCCSWRRRPSPSPPASASSGGTPASSPRSSCWTWLARPCCTSWRCRSTPGSRWRWRAHTTSTCSSAPGSWPPARASAPRARLIAAGGGTGASPRRQRPPPRRGGWCALPARSTAARWAGGPAPSERAGLLRPSFSQGSFSFLLLLLPPLSSASFLDRMQAGDRVSWSPPALCSSFLTCPREGPRLVAFSGRSRTSP
mmetsp:Transcript_68139/g.177305  ORF Transcript_68139/g.177305 Transcript_68139/m.177305 type:complete len:222 (-) Transcript_68139:95-760(-)